ncbi:NAD-P-binding protein [Multifurca ochricompacta]|uniref:NAD-P-binding protein n=1 Tax=Multifurca ochricompacta TaxID=376703 RepID=A0AAD4M0V6_9AGAM|nr:NAD-P-binding protein [Multifurca ochricompacta]
MSIINGLDENLPVTHHHDVYPAISPEPLFAAQTYRGKVVLITGASRGIGAETATAYARAGASVAVVARWKGTLDESAAAIRSAVSEAQVLAVPADVRDAKAVHDAVQATLSRFGQIDIVIANAGTATKLSGTLDSKDPDDWWNTFEVNIRGVYNTFRASVMPLKTSKGYFIAISSVGAQLRVPGASDYCISKHAVNRLVEYIAIEHPSIKTFSLHPGEIYTQLQKDTRDVDDRSVKYDSPLLPAATMLYLTSGRVDWLNGRYLSANWDLEVIEKEMKEIIVTKGGLVNKLCIPF